MRSFKTSVKCIYFSDSITCRHFPALLPRYLIFYWSSLCICVCVKYWHLTMLLFLFTRFLTWQIYYYKWFSIYAKFAYVIIPTLAVFNPSSCHKNLRNCLLKQTLSPPTRLQMKRRNNRGLVNWRFPLLIPGTEDWNWGDCRREILSEDHKSPLIYNRRLVIGQEQNPDVRR